MEALADAAADDREVELAYRGSQDFFIKATAKHIEREIAAGNMLPCHAAETARALCIMNENYLRTVLGRNPTVEPAVVVDTLTTIWIRTLYGDQA